MCCMNNRNMSFKDDKSEGGSKGPRLTVSSFAAHSSHCLPDFKPGEGEVGMTAVLVVVQRKTLQTEQFPRKAGGRA